MKKITAGAVMLLGVVMTSTVSGETFLNNEKLDLKVFTTPQSSISDSDSSKSGVQKKNWLRLKFSFKTPKTYVAKSFKSSKQLKWQDDVTVRAEILMPSFYNGKKSLAYLNGETKYAAIQLDGKEHLGRFFVQPYYFERYLRPDNAFPQTSGLKEFKVKLTFLDKSNKTIGLIYLENGKQVELKNSKKLSGYWKGALGASTTDVQKYENVVLGVDKTPWSDVRLDSYEFIKPEEEK